MQWLKDNFPGAHKAVTSVTESVTKPVQSALPSVATDSGSAKMLDAAPEPAGTTMTGGRRHRKTRGGKRGVKKTRRGGKRH